MPLTKFWAFMAPDENALRLSVFNVRFRSLFTEVVPVPNVCNVRVPVVLENGTGPAPKFHATGLVKVSPDAEVYVCWAFTGVMASRKPAMASAVMERIMMSLSAWCVYGDESNQF